MIKKYRPLRHHYWLPAVIALMLVCGLAHCSKSQTEKTPDQAKSMKMANTKSQSDSVMFGYEIICDTSYRKDQPVEIEFVLRNLSSDTLYVLQWYTPFEGILGRIFTVTRDGDTLEYQGPMVKRMPPAEGDYFLMAPGSTRSATVDLGRAYDLSLPGKYTVDYRGELDDVIRQKELIAQKDRVNTRMTAKGQAAKFVIISN